jgi:hypothetical protein
VDRARPSIWLSETELQEFNPPTGQRSLLSQVKEFLEPFRRDRPQAVSEKAPKIYQKPTLKKLTSEQARMLIVGHASVGDQGAKDLMEVLFPDETSCS